MTMTLKRPVRWIGAGAGALALATSMALGLTGVPVPSAHALYYEQVAEGPSCSWDDRQYSHGARIEVKGTDGWIRTYRCDGGSWKFVSARAA